MSSSLHAACAEPGQDDPPPLSFDGRDAASASGQLVGLNYDPATTQAKLFAAHRAWAETYARPLYPAEPGHRNDPSPERRLRIGYVSGDFRRHPVAFFVLPFLKQHDRDRFDCTCYDNNDKRDDLNALLRETAPLWREVAGLSDSALFERIRADGIDILVDLSGHTPHNRLSVFARKPAPVQVTAIGYVNTTGLETMDYRLTDAWCDPPGADDALYSETLWRLPGGFNCYAPPMGIPEPGPAPFLSNGHLTFGSFNNLDKISTPVLNLWAAILANLRNARLIMKTKSLSQPAVRERVLGHFTAAGIECERIELIEWSATLREHFETYRRVDVALDPFPYNGTTTTCESLVMGVPVIAMIGERHAARVSHSILARLKMEALCAPDADGYLARALALAAKPGVIASTRASLRQRLARSPLLAAAAYTASLEQAFREMWRRWCASSGAA